MRNDRDRVAPRLSRMLAAGALIASAALFSPWHTDQVSADGGGPAGHAKAAGCQEGRNRDVVLDALRVVFGEHRLDRIYHYFAEDFVQHSPYALPGGRVELGQWWAAMVYAVPDIGTTTTQVAVDCNDVITFRTVAGTIEHDLPDLGIVGRGQHFEIRTADIFRVRDGRITDHWEVVDTGPLVALAHAG